MDVQKKYKSETGESMGKPDKRLKKILWITGITGAVYGTFRYLLPLVVPFLLAWAAALLLRPSAERLAGHCHLRVPVLRKRAGGFRRAGEFRGYEEGFRRYAGERPRGQRGLVGKYCTEWREVFLPVGIAGMGEFALLLAAFLAALYIGGSRLCRETGLFLEQVPSWVNTLDIWLTGICHQMEDRLYLRPDCLVLLMREMLRGLMESVKKAAMPYMVTNSVSLFRRGVDGAVVSVVFLMAVGLFLQEMDGWRRRCSRSRFSREFALVSRRLAVVANAYWKTQGILILLTSLICTLGFWLLGNPYYILSGIGIGILDALPVFGTGTVLLPWALAELLRRKWKYGLGLLALYLICYCMREYLEAKLMGDQVGLSPLETLMSMYVGLELFGIWGFFLGPVGLLLIEDLVKELEKE